MWGLGSNNTVHELNTGKGFFRLVSFLYNLNVHFVFIFINFFRLTS